MPGRKAALDQWDRWDPLVLLAPQDLLAQQARRVPLVPQAQLSFPFGYKG